MQNPARTPQKEGFPSLPGTLDNLFDQDVIDNYPCASPGASSPRPPPPPPAKADTENPRPPPLSLPEQVDDFGWTLVAAIRDFRTHVEEVFAEHYQSMKRAEDDHKMMLAKLAAENGQLRERLGLIPQGPSLLQNIHFQQCASLNAPEPKSKKVKSAEQQLMAEMAGTNFAKKSTADAKKEAESGARPGMAPVGPMGLDPMMGGGNWETFVAWVPAGAALLCPQPWKQLPDEAFIPVDLAPKEVEADDDGKTWEVLEMWEAEKDELDQMRKRCGKHMEAIVPVSEPKPIDKEMHEFEEAETVQVKPQPWVIHPGCRKRIIWDLGSMTMVLYDMVMIPMVFSFDLTSGSFIDVMTWATRLFWTADMMISPCTAIVMPDGTITFDQKYLLTCYLKTWFTLDLLIVASDWTEFIMSQGGGGGSFSKLTRIFRIVRCVRLLRLMKMATIMEAITERVQSETFFFFLEIVKLTVFVVSTSHVLGCLWWGIGNRGGETWSSGWVDGKNLANNDIISRYLISLHWTLCQFSGGLEEITPVGGTERLFIIIVWVIAFMGAALIASILTSSLVRAHIIGGSQARQLATLRKYLNQNTISKNLALRVQRSAKHAISGDLSPDAVDLLQVVSEQLRLEMHFEMYSELFRSHPFFDQCIQACAQVMRRINHQATSTLLLDAGDVLFSKGEAPAEPKMYFFFKGTLEYTPPAGDPIVLGERQWIAEPVLWLQWVHRGQLKAISDIKVAKLDARKFQDIMERFKEVFPPAFNPKVYANDIATALNSEPNLEKVNDLSGLY